MTEQEKALNALKSLESYNYREHEVTIENVKITLAPLTAGEVVEVFEASGKYDDVDAAQTALRIQTIARSIIIVNDVRFPAKGLLDRKLEIVSSMGDELLDYLFDQYCVFDKVMKATAESRELKTEVVE